MKNIKAINQLEEELQDLIKQLEPIENEPKGRGRPRILPSMFLWVGYLVCILRGMSSQLSIWRMLSEKGLWHYPRFKISDRAVYNRLEKEVVKPVENIYRRINEILAKRLQPYNQTNLAPFAKKAVAIDCSTLDKVSRHLPTIREEKIGPSILAGFLFLLSWIALGSISGYFTNKQQI
jgi:hypothetical protein